MRRWSCTASGCPGSSVGADSSGKAIPTKWYQAVAEVLSIVYKLKRPKAA
jgi:hypothetical protein